MAIPSQDLPETPGGYQVSVGRLDSIREIREEMSRVYRIVRRKLGKDISVSDGGKLVYMLQTLASTIANVEFEARLTKIENTVNAKEN